MRKLFFSVTFGYIFLISLSPSLAQENLNGINRSAATAGANPEVGVTYGGVSLVSITLAAAVITSLLAFALEDSSDATSVTQAPASTN